MIAVKMRTALCGLLLVGLFTDITGAQTFDAESLQKLLAEADTIQACMQNIDQAELSRMQSRIQTEEAALRRLCGAGDHVAVQAHVVSMGGEMQADPTVQELLACVGLLTELLPVYLLAGAQHGAITGADICAQLPSESIGGT